MDLVGRAAERGDRPAAVALCRPVAGARGRRGVAARDAAAGDRQRELVGRRR